MNYYSEETLNKLYQDEGFISEYNKFIKENDNIQQLKKFLDNIELNKKYFRLTMNKKIGYKKRFKNQNLGEDTLAIKEINSLLNKLTDKNIDKIREKIKLKLNQKDYLIQFIIESVLDKCIVHTNYTCIYIELLLYLYSHNKNINRLIEQQADKLYSKLNDMKTEAETDYLIMCEKNKKLDKLIGHSILITELEKRNIVTGKIHPILENFIMVLSDCKEEEEKYKCVQCLYNVFKTFYGEYILPEGYNQKLNELITDEKSNKIKFKMMDIIERK